MIPWLPLEVPEGTVTCAVMGEVSSWTEKLGLYGPLPANPKVAGL